MGQADLHRVLKDLVKLEVEVGDSREFTETLAKVVSKNLDEVLKTRAVFVVIELLKVDCKECKALSKQLKGMKAELKKMAVTGGKGLQIIVEEYL